VGLLAALLGWMHVLALALWVGALTMCLLVLRNRRRERIEDVALMEQARRRCGLVSYWSVVTLIVTLAADVVMRLREAGVPFVADRLRGFLFDTPYGQASVAVWVLLFVALLTIGQWTRIPAAAIPAGMATAITPTEAPAPTQARRQALGIVAGGMGGMRQPPAAMRRNDWVRVTALLAGAVLIGTVAAGPWGTGPVPTLVEILHLSAATVWLGGSILVAAALVPYVPLAPRSRRAAMLLTLLDRFTPAVMLSALALLFTGWWENANQPHIVPALGRDAHAAAVLRVGLLLAITALSVRGALVLRPRLGRLSVRARRNLGVLYQSDYVLGQLQRLIGVNAALAVLALLCGTLATVSIASVAEPARANAGPPSSVPIARARANGLTVSLRVDPDHTGPNTFDVWLRDAAGKPLDGAAVTVGVQPQPRPTGTDTTTAGAPSATTGAQMVLTMAALGAGHYRGRATLAAGSGRWQARVAVRTGTVMAATLFAFAAASHGTTAAPASVGVPVGRAISGDWQPLGPAVLAHTLAVDGADPTRLFEGTENGVYRSTDGGAHWVAASAGLIGGAQEVWSLTFLPDHSLIAATGAGLYRSTDGAQHWLPAGLASHAIYTLAIHGIGQLVLLAGGAGGIYRSYDDGQHWSLAYNAGAAAVVSLAWPSIRPTMIVAGLNPGPHLVVESEDGGATWHARDEGLPTSGAGMMSIAVAPGANSIFAGTMGLGAYAADAAGPWQARGSGLPGLAQGDAHIGSFSFDPRSGPVLYAATPDGVYKSLDAGHRWQPFGHGLSGLSADITSLTLISHPRLTLYVTTATGVYRYLPPL